MGKLPGFSPDGVLPPGDYALSLDELKTSELVLGFGQPRDRPTWDAVWRERLVDNLAVLVGQLRQVGISEIYVNGSFVEDKDHPNDIDGYFECELEQIASGSLASALNLLDPHKVWTWSPGSRRRYPGFAKLQLPMWHVYRVELYPHYGQLCGLKDEYQHDLLFPAAFRKSRRDHRPKGIIKLTE